MNRSKQRVMRLVRTRQAAKTVRRAEIAKLQKELLDWNETKHRTVFSFFEKPSQELLDNYDIIIASIEKKLARLGA